MCSYVRRTRKKWEPIEHRMASEYAAKYFPGEKYILRCRLGPTPEEWIKKYGEAAHRWFKILKSWADLVVLTKDTNYLFEFKVYAKRMHIYQLLDYADLFFDTPELADRKFYPLKSYLVAAVARPDVPEICHRKKVYFRIYRPKWILPVLWERYNIEVDEIVEEAP